MYNGDIRLDKQTRAVAHGVSGRIDSEAMKTYLIHPERSQTPPERTHRSPQCTHALTPRAHPGCTHGSPPRQTNHCTCQLGPARAADPKMGRGCAERKRQPHRGSKARSQYSWRGPYSCRRHTLQKGVEWV